MHQAFRLSTILSSGTLGLLTHTLAQTVSVVWLEHPDLRCASEGLPPV